MLSRPATARRVRLAVPRSAGRAGGPPGRRYISATHTDIGAESRMGRPRVRHTDDPLAFRPTLEDSMSTPTRRFLSLARLLPAALLMLALATPATAQGLGGLGKKLKAAAGKSDERDGNADHGDKAPAGGNETIVVDDQTVGHLVDGLKAGRAER